MKKNHEVYIDVNWLKFTLVYFYLFYEKKGVYLYSKRKIVYLYFTFIYFTKKFDVFK